MDELGYQCLLSKCIQDGLPGGMFSKLSSTLQKKAEPALTTAFLSEKSRRGSTSPAAEGPPEELVPGHRVIIGMNGTAMGKRSSTFFATSKSAGAIRMRGRALRMEDMIAHGFHRSFLRSGGMVTKTSPSIFSFRSLLEGALTVSEIKPPIVVQKLVELGIRSAPNVDFKKDSVSADKHPPLDERLFRERHDGVVGGRIVPHSCCDHSAEGVAKLWKGKGNLAHRVCDSGSLSEAIGDSEPHGSYSSLLQAQLDYDVDKVRTEIPLKTSGSFVEARSSELNLQLHSTEVESGFMPVLEMTSPLLFSIARQASFPAADSVCVGEQLSDIYSDDPTHASSGVEIRSSDKALLRDTAVAMPPVLTIFDEDVSRVEVVDDGNSLVAGFKCTDQRLLDLQLRKVDDSTVVGDEARTADIPLGRSCIDLSESGEDLSPALLRRIEEHVPQAEVVANRGSFVVAESMFVDQMSDVQLFEELTRVLVADESLFAETNFNGDGMYSSKAAVVLVPNVPTDLEEIDARALVGMDRTTLGVAEAESTDERLLATQLSEVPSRIFGTDEADDALYRAVPESLVVVAVPESLVCTRYEEVDRVVASSTCNDAIGTSVQVAEKLSRGFGLCKSQFVQVTAQRDVFGSPEAAAVAVPPLPLLTEGNDSRVEVVVVDLMNNDKISEMAVSDQPCHVLDGSLSGGDDFIVTGSSQGAVASASPVLKSKGEHVLVSDTAIGNETGNCEDAVVDTSQGRITFSSLEERIHCSASQCVISLKDRFEGRADHVQADTSLNQPLEASRKEMVAIEDTIGVPSINVGDAQIDCIVGNVSKTDNILSSVVARVNLLVEDLLLPKLVVNKHVVDTTKNVGESLHYEERGGSESVAECSRQAALKETENGSIFIEKRRDKICACQRFYSRGNVPLELYPVKSHPVSEVVLEKEWNRLNSNALVEKSSFRAISYSGQFLREEPHPTFGHSGMSESVIAAAVPESAWNACTDSMEDTDSIIGGDSEDNYRHTQVLKAFQRLDGRAIDEDLIGGVDGYGPHRSCMSSVQLTSASVSPDDSGNPGDLGRIYIDARNEMGRVTENHSEQDHMLGRPACSRDVFKQAGLEHCKATGFTDLAPEGQIVASQFSESQAVDMEFDICGTGHESDELPSVEADLRKEGRTAQEIHVGKIVNNATDSDISFDPADQVLGPDPGVISEDLRQVLGDSDATISDSLETAQATEAELVSGKEVQSVLVTKSRARFARRLVDLQVNRILHPQGLGKLRTGHFDENEEQRCVSPLNGIGYDQLLDVEVRPYEKKARHRAYILEKATQGTGISCFHPLRSQGIIDLQTAGSRCRRNRHINPDQPVPVFVEGRDEGFEEADGGPFLRWLAHLDESNAGPVPASGKRILNNGEESNNFMIAIPSFRVFSDYEDKQQEVEKRRKLRMLLQPIASSYLRPVSLSTLHPPEYDMDDEDERWLHAWNEHLARTGLEQLISEENFEEMIEYFERRSAEVIGSAVGFFSGFLRCGKSLVQPIGGRLLARKWPSDLGLLSTNLATSGTPVSVLDSPTLNPIAIQHADNTSADGLEKDISLKRHGIVYPSFHVDRIGKSADPPATMVRHRMLISESERNPDVDTVCERLSEGSLGKSFEASALEKLCDDCCICNGGEDDENNPVYTCKQCLIHVHQSCYGIREKFRDNGGRVIAPLNWCCRKCEAVAAGRAQPNVSCVLCRKRGGALKPTVAAQKWAHIACALYTNETFFVDPDAMEPIDGIAAVMARGHDRQERCRLCGVKKGICSFCAVKDCRAPFHISCGVSQGASFELRQSKLKVVGVRSFCPRHGRITPTELAPSAELKDRQLTSSSRSEATASATASATISPASSMDDREEWSSRRSVSHPNRSFGHLAKNLCKDVSDLTGNVMSANGKGLEDADRVLSKRIRYILKRKWNESCDQASEVRLFSVCQTKYGCKTEVSAGKEESPGCNSTWQVVEPGQKLKKIKFKSGRLAQNLDLKSSPILVHQELVVNEVSPASKMKDVVPAVGEVLGSSGVKEEADILKGLSEDRFAREVKELTILEEATKLGLAPGHVLREAFVYWRAKRAEFEGSLLCELHHEQWLRSQGIFNKEANDEERFAIGKTVSFLRVAEAQQPSILCIEKTLEIAKEIRMQLERVQLMAQMIVQREKLKYNHQFVLGSIASAELTQGAPEVPHCFWCPSIKTLLKCGNCPRNFCFNCFKHRKGFGVKGWMAAMKAPIYLCKYCRESSNEVMDFSNDMDPSLQKIGEGGAVSSPGGSAIGVVSHALMIPKDALLKVVCNFLTPRIHVGDGIGISVEKERGQGGRWYSSGDGSLGVTKGGEKDLEIGCEGNIWTGRDNLKRGSEGGEKILCKPSHLEDGLNTFLSSAQRGMEHSSFEVTLRKLKILRCTNRSRQQELVTSPDEIPSGGVASDTEEMEGVMSSTTIGSHVSFSSTLGSDPALLVYKKKRRVLVASPETPPPALILGTSLPLPQ